MSRRIFGIETEFGCMADSDGSLGSSEGTAALVRDYIFHELKLGMSDMHYRDWGENRPAMAVFCSMAEGFTSIWGILSMLHRSVSAFSI